MVPAASERSASGRWGPGAASGFAALFGGLVAQNFGWRWIFIACAVVSVIGMLMVRGTPESKVQSSVGYKLDVRGIATFMVAMVALQILVTQGGDARLDESCVTCSVADRTGGRRCLRPRGVRERERLR